MSEIPVALYDSFTTRRFEGNVAGVVWPGAPLLDAPPLRIARELNAATTGFVWRTGPDRFRMRFFTSRAEVNMCGHVVVATMTDARARGALTGDRAEISTAAGPLSVEVGAGRDGPTLVTIRLSRPVFREAEVDLDTLSAAMGVPADRFDPGLPLAIASTGLRHLFVPLRGLEAMGELRPDSRALIDLGRRLAVDTYGVYTRQTRDPACDVHVRDFSPCIGDLEESASGTTNSALSCVLIRRGVLAPPQGGDVVVVHAEQGLEMGRPSRIRSEIRLEGGEIVDVRVGGYAVCTMRGVLLGEVEASPAPHSVPSSLRPSVPS